MICVACNRAFPGQCVCPDRDARIEQLKKSPFLALRWCPACDRHADLCSCADGPTTRLRVVDEQGGSR